MLTWARAPLLPQQTPLPPALQGHGLGTRGQAESRCILVSTSLCSWDQGPALLPKMRFNTDSSRKPSRLIHKGLAVLTHTQP